MATDAEEYEMPATGSKRKDNVGAPSSAYLEMAERWELIIDLLGGTLAMRRAKKKWLPQEPKENDGAYRRRLNRSILLEALKDTIDSIVSRPFSRDLVIAPEELPEVFAEIVDDVDRSKTSLKQLASDMLRDMATFGKSHVLVDFPRVPENELAANGEASVASIAQERARGARPILSHISPQNLIGWTSDSRQRTDAGDPMLTSIRIREFRLERSANTNYLDEEREYVRVITPTKWELWRRLSVSEMGKDKEEEYRLVEQGPWTLGFIPLVTVYSKRTGFLTAEPPLEPLAWLNLAHWQSSSDQRNILRIARFAVLFVRGVSQEERDKGIGALGPTRGFITTNEKAEMKYVEHTGQAIGAGQKDLDKLEAQMETLGKNPLVERSGQSTATGKSIDHSKNMSQVQQWVRALELAIQDGFKFAGKWMNQELPGDFKVDIFSDFRVSNAGSNEVKLLIESFKSGGISHELLLREMKRRGFLGEGADIELELENQQDNEPPLPTIDPGEDDPEDDPDDDPEDD